MAKQHFDIELKDGRTFKALPIENRVLVEWDFERAKPGKNWPLGEQAKMLWANWVVWRQLILNEELPADTQFQHFRESICDDIEGVPAPKPEEGDLGDPTRQAQPPDSA